jgi:hypothetical protein
MIPLFRKRGTSPEAWTIGLWHESHADEAAMRFHDRMSAGIWLRSFESDDLRRIAQQYKNSTSLCRLADHQIIERLAGLIVSGYLRVCRAGTEGVIGTKRPGAGRGVSAEDKIILRLRVTARDFTFEGDRLRVIRADQWSSMQANNDGRYQVVPRDVAQTLLTKMSEWPAISTDEKSAIAEAVSLVPDTHRQHIPDGILVVRIVARSGTQDKAGGEPASTPSQLAGRLQKDKLHWVEIVLLDLSDKPVPNEAYELELPDGEIRKGKLDSNGRVYIGDIRVPGQCRVCFPEIDGKEWRAA